MEDPQTRTVEVVSVRRLKRGEQVRVEAQSGNLIVIIEREPIPKKIPDSA